MELRLGQQGNGECARKKNDKPKSSCSTSCTSFDPNRYNVTTPQQHQSQADRQINCEQTYWRINIGSRTFICVEIFHVDCFSVINDERMLAHGVSLKRVRDRDTRVWNEGQASDR